MNHTMSQKVLEGCRVDSQWVHHGIGFAMESHNTIAAISDIEVLDLVDTKHTDDVVLFGDEVDTDQAHFSSASQHIGRINTNIHQWVVDVVKLDLRAGKQGRRARKFTIDSLIINWPVRAWFLSLESGQ